MVAAGALRVALAACAAAGAAASATGPTAFAAISDWGGTSKPPYTTPAQVAVAGALDTVVAKNNIEFVLSAGNNFMPNGLPGAYPGHVRRPAAAAARRAACAHAGRGTCAAR